MLPRQAQAGLLEKAQRARSGDGLSRVALHAEVSAGADGLQRRARGDAAADMHAEVGLLMTQSSSSTANMPHCTKHPGFCHTFDGAILSPPPRH